MPTFLIRKLKAEDADDIRGIAEAIARDSGKIDFNNLVERQLQDMENASFVSECEGKVVGYMISYSLSGSFGIEKSAWIAVLGVDPKFMGQGIGKMLAEETFKYYKRKGIKHIYTSVRWDSTDLLSFFQSLDFDRTDFINLGKCLE